MTFDLRQPETTLLGQDRAKKLARLTTAKGRREQGAILLDSVPLIEEGLVRGLVTELLVEEGTHRDLVARAGLAGVRVTPADPARLARITSVETPAGVAAVAAPPPAPDDAALKGLPSLFAVFLDRIADPGNLGTIARTAAAFGCELLVVSPGCADPLAPKTLRASAGALLRLPFLRADFADETTAADWKLQRIRAVARGGRDPEDVAAAARFALWLGNESRGARPGAGPGVVDVTIPMAPGSESLNVAAAAAVLLHVVRRR